MKALTQTFQQKNMEFYMICSDVSKKNIILIRSSYTALLSYEEYLERAPLIVIDCSRQSDTIKKGLVDVRLEFQTKGNVPANTTAYCLIIHENMISYSPYSNIVSKVA